MTDIRNIETFMFNLGRAAGRSDGSTPDTTPVPVEIVKRPANLGAAFGKAVESAAFLFGFAWELMLLVGAIHSTEPAVPAISYWTAVWVLLAVGTLGYSAGLRPIPIRELRSTPKRKSR